MKIAIFFTYDYSLQGWESSGVLNRELAIYEKLSEVYGLEFIFFTYGDITDLDLKISNKFKTIPFYSLFKKNTNKYLQLINSFLIPFKIKKELQEVDILHQHQLHGVWVPIICKILYRKKLLVRTGYDMHYFSIKDKKNLLIKTFFKFLTYISLKVADIYTVTSHEDEKRILSSYGSIAKNVKLRPNWVKKINLDDLKDRKKTNILSVGRLVYQKNFDELIKEFKDTKDEYQINIIGEGEQKDFLIKLAKDMNVNLNIIGNMSNEELIQVYKKYKYYVSFSLFEGNPKAVLESMASGCIPICSKIPSHTEIVKDNVNGMVFDLEKPELLNVLKYLNENDSVASELSQNAIEKVRENNSIELVSDMMYSDYKILNS